MSADSTGPGHEGMASDRKQHFFDQPKNVRIVMRVFYAACAIAVVLDIVNLIQHWTGAHELRHAEHSLETLPEFYVLYGFVGVTLLVLVSKGMRKILMRDEDYYDR